MRLLPTSLVSSTCTTPVVHVEPSRTARNQRASASCPRPAPGPLEKRLHAGIGYVTPNDEHQGRGPAIRQARRNGMAHARRTRLAYHRNRRDNPTP
jgi:hypothetical protein